MPNGQSDEEVQGSDLVATYLKLLEMARAHAELEAKYQGKYALVITPPSSGASLESDEEPFGREEATPSLPERSGQMAQLAAAAATCTRCKLAQTRTQVVFGAGPVNAELVIVGEAPGFYEDREGLPFVGDAGRLLTKMLGAIGLRRDEVYICNVLKCRPPNNREPAPEEVIACSGWLKEQLGLLRPKLICAMGRFASQSLTGIAQPMGQYRGRLYQYQGIPVICTYHPAYLLRNTEEKRKAWQDLQKVRKLLDGGPGPFVAGQVNESDGEDGP